MRTFPEPLWGPYDVCFSSVRQAHQRRISKFKDAAASAKPDDDAQEILSVAFASAALQPEPPSNDPAPLSNRAARRVSAHSYPYSASIFFFSHIRYAAADLQVREDEN
jgi:hypothetical protein